MATEVEILEHKAKIVSITGQLTMEPGYKEDHLVVLLSFDEAVSGILSFVVFLPVKKYEREEFLYNVRRRGEEALKQLLAKNEDEKRKNQKRDQRQKELDVLAAEAQSLIE